MEVLHSFANSKGKMVILYLEKYGQILYQNIALRVWVPTQQTTRDFKFPSPSYARFTKMCLAGRGALDISNLSRCLRAESKFELLDRGVLDMSNGATGHVERDLGRKLLTSFHIQITYNSLQTHIQPLPTIKTNENPLEKTLKYVSMTKKQSKHELLEFL